MQCLKVLLSNVKHCRLAIASYFIILICHSLFDIFEDSAAHSTNSTTNLPKLLIWIHLEAFNYCTASYVSINPAWPAGAPRKGGMTLARGPTGLKGKRIIEDLVDAQIDDQQNRAAWFSRHKVHKAKSEQCTPAGNPPNLMPKPCTKYQGEEPVADLPATRTIRLSRTKLDLKAPTTGFSQLHQSSPRSPCTLSRIGHVQEDLWPPSKIPTPKASYKSRHKRPAQEPSKTPVMDTNGRSLHLTRLTLVEEKCGRRQAADPSPTLAFISETTDEFGKPAANFADASKMLFQNKLYQRFAAEQSAYKTPSREVKDCPMTTRFYKKGYLDFTQQQVYSYPKLARTTHADDSATDYMGWRMTTSNLEDHARALSPANIATQNFLSPELEKEAREGGYLDMSDSESLMRSPLSRLNLHSQARWASQIKHRLMFHTSLYLLYKVLVCLDCKAIVRFCLCWKTYLMHVVWQKFIPKFHVIHGALCQTQFLQDTACWEAIGSVQGFGKAQVNADESPVSHPCIHHRPMFKSADML